MYFTAYYFSQLPSYSSQPAHFPTQNSFLHNNKKINPPYFQSCLILVSSQLTTLPSNRNRTSAICPQLKCSFPKLLDENITFSGKDDEGVGLGHLTRVLSLLYFEFNTADQALCCSMLPKTHRSPALISLVLAVYWFISTQVYEITPTKNWDDRLGESGLY